MRYRTRSIAVLAVLMAVSCSNGNGSSASPTTAAAPSISSPTSTTASPSEEADSPSTTAPTSESTPATTSAEEPPGTSPEQPIEELLASRVRSFFDVREAANAGPQPDPANPALQEVASGEALDAAVAETQRRLDAGRAIRPGDQALAEIRVGSVQADDAIATVSACSIDDGVIYDVATGEVVNDDVVTHNYLIDLEQSGAQWKVVRITRLQQWEGVAGCALAPGDFPY